MNIKDFFLGFIAGNFTMLTFLFLMAQLLDIK